MVHGKGVTLDLWQRQAVLAAAALLRERFGTVKDDTKAKAVHDALLEVVEPKRRALRLQREMSKAADGAVLTAETDRRGSSRERRTTPDRRAGGPPQPVAVERRRSTRRGPTTRRSRSR